jgi:hypothetical protein
VLCVPRWQAEFRETSSRQLPNPVRPKIVVTALNHAIDSRVLFSCSLFYCLSSDAVIPRQGIPSDVPALLHNRPDQSSAHPPHSRGVLRLYK